jgi:hypothetical protein
MSSVAFGRGGTTILIGDRDGRTYLVRIPWRNS